MKDIRDRLHLAIIDAIKDVETNNKEETGVKLEYLVNVSKILDNYEQLRPILMKYFKDEIERKKLEIRTDKELSNDQKREQLKALSGLELAEDNLKRRSEMQWEK